ATLGGRRLQRIAIQPCPDVEIVKLLVPKHAGKGLPLDPAHILIADAILQRGIKGVGLADAPGEDLVEPDKGVAALLAGTQPHANGRGTTGRNRSQVKSGRLGAWAYRVYRIGAVVHDVFVKRVLEIAVRGTDPEQPREIGFVLAEQQAIRALECDAVGAELIMGREQHTLPLVLQRRFLYPRRPAPGVAKPDLWQHVDARLIGAAIVDRDP